jgi:hypothetical protein
MNAEREHCSWINDLRWVSLVFIKLSMISMLNLIGAAEKSDLLALYDRALYDLFLYIHNSLSSNSLPQRR